MKFRRVLAALMVASCVGCAQGDTEAEIQALIGEGRFDESLAQLRIALDEDPDQPALQLLYGRLLLGRGDLHLAEWPLRKAAESPEHRVAASKLLAQVLLNTRNAEGAVAVIDQVLGVDPNDVAALEFRSRAHLAALDLERALEDAERLIELDPDHMAARTTRLHALLLQERAEDAEAALRDLIDRIASDPEAHDEATHARVCALECRFALEKGDTDGAFARVQECIEEFPADKLVIREAAEHFSARGDYERLLAILRTAVESEPDDTELRVALAGQLRATGNPEAGEAVLREGIERRSEPRPSDWRALYEHFWQARDYAQAALALQESIELMREPGTTDLLLLADAHIELGDYAAAEAVAGQLDTGYSDLIFGRVRLEQGDPAGARESLLRGVRVWPNNATARVWLGEAASRLGNIEEALGHYTEAYRIEYGHNAPPEKSDSALRIARIQAAMGSYEGALDFANQHLSAHPSDADAMALVVEIAAQLGQSELATRGLRALAQVPGKLARSVALQSELTATSEGVLAAIHSIEQWELDLTRPANFEALDALVKLHQREGQHTAALTLAERAASARPAHAGFQALRGQALLGVPSRSEEARTSLERALELDPENVAALVGVARIEMQAGELDRARSLYDRAAKADASRTEAAYEIAALLARTPGREGEARKRLEALLAQHPLELRAATALALLKLEDDPEAALALATRAVRFGGTFASADAAGALEALGRVQLARGAVAESLTLLGEAVAADAARASAHHHLGRAREAAGDLAGAKAAFHAALELPDYADREQVRSALAQLEAQHGPS